MFCPYCGHEAKRTDEICTACGRDLPGAASDETPPKPLRRLHFGRPEEQEDLFSMKPEVAAQPPEPGDFSEAEVEDWELDIGHIGTVKAPPLKNEKPKNKPAPAPKAKAEPSESKPVTPKEEAESTESRPAAAARKRAPQVQTPKAPAKRTPTLDELAATEFDFGSAAKARAVSPTSRPTALGASPLADPPEEPQKTSEELKRVLQTVFATSQARPQPTRPGNSADSPAPQKKPAPVPPSLPKETGNAPAAPQSKVRATRDSEWEIGGSAPVAVDPPAPTRVAEREPEPTPEISRPRIAPAPEAPRKASPDMADFWTSSSTRSKQRQMVEGPRHDVDVGETDEDDATEATDEFDTAAARIDAAAAFADVPECEIDTEDDPAVDERRPGGEGVRVREEVQEVQVTVAGVGRRVLAALIDGALWALLTAIFLMIAVGLLGSARLPDLDASGPWYLVRLAIDHGSVLPAYLTVYLFLSLVLSFTCTATTGQTPGKMLMDVRVIQTDGEPLAPLRVAVRLVGFALAALPFLLGLFWAVIDSRKQGIHDKLAGSYVIRSSSLHD